MTIPGRKQSCRSAGAALKSTYFRKKEKKWLITRISHFFLERF